MRAKVIKKPPGKERFYGRVGTVVWQTRCFDCSDVGLDFGTGEVVRFKASELRMGVKASG